MVQGKERNPQGNQCLHWGPRRNLLDCKPSVDGKIREIVIHPNGQVGQGEHFVEKQLRGPW